MSESFNICYKTLHVGAFNGATEVPLGHVALGGGGVSVVEATLYSPAAGTVVGGLLVTMGTVATGGTPAINGTVGSLAGTVTTAAGVIHKFTISTPFIEKGYYLGFDQTSGTVPAGTFIEVGYVMGKSG